MRSLDDIGVDIAVGVIHVACLFSVLVFGVHIDVLDRFGVLLVSSFYCMTSLVADVTFSATSCLSCLSDGVVDNAGLAKVTVLKLLFW